MNEQEPMSTQQLVAEGLYTDGSPENQPLSLSDFLMDVARNMHEIAGAQSDMEQADAMFSQGMSNFFTEVAEAMGLAISNATDPDLAMTTFVRQLESCVTHYMEAVSEVREQAQAVAAIPATPATTH